MFFCFFVLPCLSEGMTKALTQAFAIATVDIVYLFIYLFLFLGDISMNWMGATVKVVVNQFIAINELNNNDTHWKSG